MLVIALVLFILAGAFFVFDFIRSNWVNFVSLGLALLAGGLVFWMIDILQAKGTL